MKGELKVNKVLFSVPEDQVKRVKGLGFLKDKTTQDKFNARVLTGNGKISAKDARIVLEAAEKFGSGEVALTTRQTIEVQAIPYDNIEPFLAYLKEHNLIVGGTGPRVRPVVSCKGTTCHFGLVDTYGLSMEIHKRFYLGYHHVTLPHKFKIAVGGCPNNCVKPDLNDLGIIGCAVPVIDFEKCRGCGKCAVKNACPVDAVSVCEGKVRIDEKECIRCGRCDATCPFGAVNANEAGYRVLIGGRWGKKSARGIEIERIFKTEEEVLSFVEKTILYFKENGLKGERFADTIQRIGFATVQDALLKDDILERKEEILSRA